MANVEGEFGIKAAFERMYVCGNKACSYYGDDTPDSFPGNNHCLMCGAEKVHWTTIPQSDLDDGLLRCLRKLELIKS